MTTRAEHVDRLRALADALDPALAHSLRALLEADSHAHTCQDLMDRTERAEDLVAELRRQVDPLRRTLDTKIEENRELRSRLGIDPWTPVHTPAQPAEDTRTLRQRVKDSRIPVLPSPPPAPPAPRIHG